MKKYSELGVAPDALTMCNLARPIITKTENKDNIIYFTCGAKVEKCPQSQAAVGTVRIFKMDWEKGKIISIAFKGRK